ncbi:hypothetical protein [Mucisphaera sp.]|uniref:hypothetical protein n=1 Tax=Mucisphaera sp. TaxID=2913024 RepID=UPI003D132D0C
MIRADNTHRLETMTHAIEDTVLTVAEDSHAHRYMDDLAQLLGRVHELRDAFAPSPANRGHDEVDGETPLLEDGLQELSHRSIWLEHNARTQQDEHLARAFEGLSLRLSEPAA